MWRTLYRLYGSSAKNAIRSPLATLRRRTGFPLNKCRQALDSCSDNVEEAEKWLRAKADEEGWQKTQSLSGREVNQGLIGAAAVGNIAAVVEINCETDFVARTDDFKDLVALVTAEILKMANLSTKTFQLEREELGLLGDCTIVKDALARTVGKVSENVVLSLGGVLFAREETNGVVSSFVYNNVLQSSENVGAGRYACLLHMIRDDGCTRLIDSDMVAFGSRIAQHIIGLNPKCIVQNGNGNIGGSDILLKQPFIFDSSRTVGEVLSEEKMAVTSFVRVGISEITEVVDKHHCDFLSFSIRS